MEAISQSALRRNSRRVRPHERPCYTRRPIVGSVAIEFPVPPSTNSLFFNVGGRGRTKTPAYRSWRSNAALVVSLKRPGRISGPCRVAITLPPGRADGDNLVKPCLDVAVEIGVIADDSPEYVVGHSVDRDASASAVRMVFTMVAIDELDRAEVEVRAKEGQSVAYIAACGMGLTEGQVQAILAGARP